MRADEDLVAELLAQRACEAKHEVRVNAVAQRVDDRRAPAGPGGAVEKNLVQRRVFRRDKARGWVRLVGAVPEDVVIAGAERLVEVDDDPAVDLLEDLWVAELLGLRRRQDRQKVAAGKA